MISRCHKIFSFDGFFNQLKMYRSFSAHKVHKNRQWPGCGQWSVGGGSLGRAMKKDVAGGAAWQRGLYGWESIIINSYAQNAFFPRIRMHIRTPILSTIKCYTSIGVLLQLFVILSNVNVVARERVSELPHLHVRKMHNGPRSRQCS